MATQALARKWRPKNFHEVVGQKHVVTALTNGLDNNRLHHAFLLTGTRGVGKTTLARILAKSLNCEQGVSSHPCGVCSICQEVDQGRFVDLIEIDAASRTKVEDTREILDNVQYAPTRGRYKVYLIDEVHMLSNSSFNALLKTLEEPPEHVKFILATTDPQKLPVTVLSRCLRFHLKKIPSPEITGYLTHIMDAEGIDYQPKALELIAKAGAGSMRDSLSLLDQGIAYTNGHVSFEPIQTMLGLIDDQYALMILRALATLNQSALLAASKQVMDSGADPYALLEALIEAFHQLTLLQIDTSFIDLDDTHQESWLALAQAMSAEDLQLYYQIALHGRKDLEMHPEPLIGLEMTLLRMLLFTPKGAPKKAAAPSAKTPQAEPIVHAPKAHADAESVASLTALLDDVAPQPAPVDVEPTKEAPALPVAPPEIVTESMPIDDAPIYDDVPPWIDAEAYESITAVESAPSVEPEVIAPVASAPAEPIVQPSEVNYPLNNNEDWLEIVRNLSISGLTQGIVRNLVLERFSDDWLVLKRSTEDHAFNIPAAEANIAEAVSELLGRQIRCSIVATEQVIEEDDFNHRAEKELAARKVQVLSEIHADPVVQFLVNTCDAEVLDSTLKLKHE